MLLLALLLLALLLLAAVWKPEAVTNARHEYEDRGGLSAREYHDRMSDDFATDDPMQPQGYFDGGSL